MHGICGEVEDPEGNEMNRIYPRCVGKRKKGRMGFLAAYAAKPGKQSDIRSFA